MKKSRAVMSRVRGLTLIEVILVLLVMGVLLVVALPSLSAAINNNRLSSLTNHMLADLAMARSESIRLGGRVALCASTNGTQCNSHLWHQGRILFIDDDQNGAVDAGERIMRQTHQAPGGWVIRGNTPVSRYVSYNSMGQTRLISGAFQAGTITICPVSATAVEATQIVINSVGRARSRRVNLPECAP